MRGAIPSGPAALWDFSPVFFRTYSDVMNVLVSFVLNLIGSGSGITLMSSLVKMLLKAWFNSAAISFSSVARQGRTGLLMMGQLIAGGERFTTAYI